MNPIRHPVEGANLAVYEEGEGMPFVFQHGLCGDQAQPGQVFPAAAGFRRITVECRGHGASDAGSKAAFSIATFADDIAGYLAAQGAGRAVVGGISMGAAIALRLAVRRPERVRALVIARPAWICAANPANMAPNRIAGELLDRYPPQEARRQYEALPLAAELEREAPDNLASIRGFFTREPIDVTAALLRAISMDGPDVTEAEVSAIAVPTLVIGHGRDLVHPLGHARSLAGMIPGARLVEITPKADDADAYRADFRAALSAFLKEL
ncbi:alpha/beta fold hydrolase [Shinella zoogloeoides]|uniref:alpha/beta fold hydrolase n=1 Tax=Shinella zoogloeoides TaxID=352475 RepID=UPI000E657DA3|nr:alpha/beta fold hydrolase [Shinella zoogloeoides]